MEMEDIGLWTDSTADDNATVRHLLLQFSAVSVRVLDQDMVQHLNDNVSGCPCGGVWKVRLPLLRDACFTPVVR